jgi:hypothetical protein
MSPHSPSKALAHQADPAIDVPRSILNVGLFQKVVAQGIAPFLDTPHHGYELGFDRG